MQSPPTLRACSRSWVRIMANRIRRTETPEWLAMVATGALDHLEDLARRDIITADQQSRLDHYAATGEYKGPTDPLFT